MSTRANVVIKYQDRKIGVPSELWLYHHHDGNVQGIGEAIVQAVRAWGRYVEDGAGLERLWDKFPPEFENVTGLEEDIEFLYRFTYADDAVTVVARHGGYVGERAQEDYNRANDTADNSVELLHMTFKGNEIVSIRHDIREPESYIRTLREADRCAVRAWRGRLS